LSSGVSDVRREFPILTPPQVARAAAHGQTRATAAGDVLQEAGGTPLCLVLLSGRLEVERPSEREEPVVVTHLGPGQFSGEVSLLQGRRPLMRIRATEPGEVVVLTREELLDLVQTDSEIGDAVMRAFLLRRANILSQGLGDVILVGSEQSADTLRLREFLGRNVHPCSYLDVDGSNDVRVVMDAFRILEAHLPVVICRGITVLRNPTNQQLADCLGFNDAVDRASEGLDVLILELLAPGGQAGSSSKIENYLGFPTGISGQDLGARAYAQAQKFGADVLIGHRAVRLRCSDRLYVIELEDGRTITTRTVVIATGAVYRRLDVTGLARFEGAGVYYAAGPMEGKVCRGEEVVIVGGGNAAGQAAVYLSSLGSRVHLLVRGDLDTRMSSYLVRRIQSDDLIVVRTSTDVTALEGDDHLARVSWCDRRTGEVGVCAARHLFSMTGAVPDTAWLDGCVARDQRGFVRTGLDIEPAALAAHSWSLERRPYSLETSRPGVFAVGDVRSESMKRVASAVGEGSTAVAYVHRVLSESSPEDEAPGGSGTVEPGPLPDATGP
jgi:thioredoxin reductase (NADPH)